MKCLVRVRRIAAFVLPLALHLAVTPCAAQTLWGDLELPGGVAAARELFTLGDATRSDGALIIDFTRRYYGNGVDDSAMAETFERYVAHLLAFDTQLRGWPQGLQLPKGVVPRNDRDRWRNLCELMGLRYREVRNQALIEIDKGDDATLRASWLAAAGIDRAIVAADLNARKLVQLTIPRTALPLPLPGIWNELLDGSERVPLVVRLMKSRKHMLLYTGLVALDRETLQYFAQQAERIKALSDEDVGILAGFGGSLRVRGGVVQTPGEASDQMIWEELADASPKDPERFIRNWLRRHDGRVAYFYDAVSHLAPTHQSWLLARAVDPKVRLRSARRTYERFISVEESWKAQTRPFHRPSQDAGLLLSLLDITESGTVGPPWWPRVLERIVDGPEWPDEPLDRVELRVADAEWTLDWLYQAPADTERRFRMLRFAQRVFLAAPQIDAGLVETSLRAFYRMPALMLTLERLGVRSPKVLSELAERVHAVTIGSDPKDAEPWLTQLQSALSLLEQVARHRPIPSATLDPLLARLSAAITARDRELSGAVAAWIAEAMLPALTGPGSATTEAALIGALLPTELDAPLVSWEGLQYRLDRRPPLVRSAVDVRTAMRSTTLPDLLALHAIRRELERAAPTPEQVRAIAERLRKLQPSLALLRDHEDKVFEAIRRLDGVVRTLSRVKSVRDASRAGREAEDVRAAIDVITMHVVPAVAYALAVSPTTQPRLYADLWRRHTFWVEGEGIEWRDAVWMMSTLDKQPGGGLRVRGSLLALDVPLAESQTRLVPGGPVPGGEPALNVADQRVYESRLVFSDVKSMSEAPSETGASTNEASVISSTRRNLLAWASQRDTRVAAGASAAELLATAGPTSGLATFAVPAMSFDGCLCLRHVPLFPVEHLLGRAARGVFVLPLVETSLQLQKQLQALDLPPVLAEHLLPHALGDLLTVAAQFSPDDWETVLSATRVTRERVEEYLLALVAEGVLAPPPQ